MPLSVYLSRDLSETHEDVNLALTELEQKLCKHFVRITIVGKRGRKVPVLLTPLMRESLDTLVEKREECGVLTENGFLFALPHSVHHLRGSDCIRQCQHGRRPGSEDETIITSLQERTFAQNQRREFAKKRVAGITETQESEDADSVTPLPDSTSAASAQNQRSSAKTRDGSIPEAQESEDEASTASLQERTSTASAQNQTRFSKKRGKQTVVKRTWTPEECAAVERHLKKFILMNQVPGKEDCQRCISAEPQALKSRDWRAVKYFVKNRIASLRRKLE
ncbi:uncharacterized protein LOC121524186 [Cheilinus undulatus]|uniref:uncharacterized protein LOC121524186 n=1 Tax=Cheilinus undulatus TaxID=241271 RepID=UPI001BD5FC5C|nr:uncharacterized protein LOC121524186 [Cheilinus undulatus]